MSQLLFLRIDAHDLNAGIPITAGSYRAPEQIFFVDSTIKQIGKPSGHGPASYWTGRQMAVMGNTFDGTNPDGQHLIRVAFADRAVFSHNLIKNSSFGVEMLTVRAPDSLEFFPDGTTPRYRYEQGIGSGENAATKYVIVGQNQINTDSFNSMGIDAGGVAEVTSGIEHDVIVEGNWFPLDTEKLATETSKPGTGCIKIRATQVTVRNNICDFTHSSFDSRNAMHILGTLPSQSLIKPADDVWIYNNTVYSSKDRVPDAMTLASIDYPPIGKMDIRNNVVYITNLNPWKPNDIVNSTTAGTITMSNNGTTSPLFAVTSPTKPSDYKPTATSYIGTGTTTPTFFSFFGRSWPVGTPLDIGALLR